MQLKTRVWDSVEKRFLYPSDYWLNAHGDVYLHAEGGEPYGVPMSPTKRFIVSYSTGELDKNKKEIYSDDIVTIPYYEEDTGGRIDVDRIIIFENAAFITRDIKGMFEDLYIGEVDEEVIENIGNKYENPELLEV